MTLHSINRAQRLLGALMVAMTPIALSGQQPARDSASREHQHTAPQPMVMAGVLGIPMDRMGSGTTWIPDAVSLPSRHVTLGKWSVMLHGFVFGEYDHQSGPRGDDQWGVINWGMLMASRALGGGQIQLRTMLSLDPATITSRGYPLLGQTGETYKGEPLRDRQHPHDLFKELGVLYERPITSSVGLTLYAAPSGEPALGPVAFMHRPSAMDDPIAPLGHHWQDATHISYGVVTAGIFTRRWKLEGSYFNSREPNEDRWDFDRIRLDSYSGRLTVNPDSQWSLTLGHGFLKSHDALAPDVSMRRTTASMLHGRRLGRDAQWATAIVWGLNTGHAATQAILLESELILDGRHTIFARAERVEKTADEVLSTDGGGFPPEWIFDVASFSLGYIREIARPSGLTVGLGVRGTLNIFPSDLEPVYGSRTPTGLVLYLRLRPARASAAD
ncbi:MAG TPA: hypothetical protein VH762_01275, partial [Gemmatimonadaceae bacterium]